MLQFLAADKSETDMDLASPWPPQDFIQADLSCTAGQPSSKRARRSSSDTMRSASS